MLATREEREALQASFKDLIEDSNSQEGRESLLKLYSFHIIKETIGTTSSKLTSEEMWGMCIMPK